MTVWARYGSQSRAKVVAWNHMAGSSLTVLPEINGLIAGALSDSDRIGYVGAFPIPEVKRHINAFAIGAKEAWTQSSGAGVVVAVLDSGVQLDHGGGEGRDRHLLHLVQRRRADIRSFLGATKFPARMEAEQTYQLSADYRSLFDKVLAYARETVREHLVLARRRRAAERNEHDVVAGLRARRAVPRAVERDEDAVAIARRTDIERPMVLVSE